ncbi:MAG: serine protease inhibitor ecotin [Campylobacterota bacterium]|nr:serine protease inhibitor ecotin [Campylobacterota bacterium]
MIKKITLAMAVTLAGLSLYAETEKKDNIHMFPQAKEGFVRHVIEVPKTDNDYDHKVELLIGKNMMVDCNQHSLRGKIENVTLKGWGYKYLEVSDIQNGPSTMMACSEPKTEKFITLYMGKETLRRYNSRSPIVAYVPKGYEVRYRIWSAGDKVQQAKQR